MTAIDFWLGARAEFLNAWSVWQRVFGVSPAAGDSMMAARYGVLAEALVVVVANALIAALLMWLWRTLGNPGQKPE